MEISGFATRNRVDDSAQRSEEADRASDTFDQSIESERVALTSPRRERRRPIPADDIVELPADGQREPPAQRLLSRSVRAEVDSLKYGWVRSALERHLPVEGRFVRVKRALHRSFEILDEEGVWQLGVKSTRKAGRVAQRVLRISPEARAARAAQRRVNVLETVKVLLTRRHRAGRATRSLAEATHLLEHRCQGCERFNGANCELAQSRPWRSPRKAFHRSLVDPTGACPEGNWPGMGGPPITRLNLVYFVFPMKHPARVWQWNVAELLKRIHLFNGRRIITIAVDWSSASRGTIDSPEEVVAAFAGHDVEFRFVVNDPRRGEAPHFLPAMRELASTNPGEAVFYAHAKGVSRQQESEAVRAWTAAMYHDNLDRIDEVRDLLRRWPCAGIAKWRGFPESFLEGKKHPEFAEEGRTWHGWHYSGTFWWVRHDALFSIPDWDQVETYKYATEKYLANFFRADEAICLAYDNCNTPYEIDTWRTEPRERVTAPAVPLHELKAA